jgi:AcrR family transcriptional regulator
MAPVGIREQRRRDTTALIVETAWDICRHEGLAGLSLRDLAARVGMRAPSLYSYFESKHAIYDAMFRQGNEEFAEAMRGAVPDGQLDRSALKAAARAFVDFCTADPVRYQLLFQRTIPGFEPSPESFAVSIATYEEMRRQLTAVGLESEEALDLWTAIVTGLADQQISNDPGGVRWARLTARAVDMYLDHMGVLPAHQGEHA